MPFVLHRVVGSRTVLRTVDQRNLRIGRGAGCELRLEDTAVGLEHALIREDPSEGRSRYHLADLGSVTGTYLNGEPVATALLRDGDEVGVGGFLIRVRRSDPEDPLFLHIRPADAEPRPGAPALPVESVDYGTRYRLKGRLWTKGVVAVVLGLVAVAVVAAIPAARRTDAFQPGDLTSFHSDRIDAASCSSCHTPWRGVADASCQACHGEGQVDAAPLHHPESVVPASADAASLACTTCHREHMGRDGLMPANDAPCRSCHGGLEVAAGVEALFAADVPSFAEHPEIRLTLPAEGGAGARGSGFRRVPVTDPEARRSDPTVLGFNHAQHLAKPLQLDDVALEPGGGETELLTCESCHEPEGGQRAGTDFVAIAYEDHCYRCHALTVGEGARGGQAGADPPTATHGPPDLVLSSLRTYFETRGGGSRSARADRLSFLGPGRRAREERVRTVDELVSAAVEAIYLGECSDCHVGIDTRLESLPPERVEPPAIPTRWLPHARFSHGEHLQLEGLECSACHAGVEESKETADVLLPSIASCTPCHAPEARGRAGETASVEGASFPVTPGPSSCRTCHDYHSGNRFPGSAVAARSTGGAP